MKIAIIGGGTAGWLAALFFLKVIKNAHSVTLIESSKIGIIGAGEGSTGLLNGVINNLVADFGCNEQEFFKETNSTLKLGIRYNDWNFVGSSYVQPIDSSYTALQTPDSHFLFSLIKENKFKNKPHTMTPLGYLLEEKKSTFYQDGVNNIGLHAYHFDAHLVGQYFKKLSLNSGAQCIDAEVIDVNLKEDGNIQSVTMQNGETISADFFIDASGFNRILLTKMGIKYSSYKKHLPVNSALTFQLPYKENEIIEPSTLAQAKAAGWMWRIPVKERYGCGYVFCDDYITPEQAQAEIEQSLGHDIEPNQLIKFESGHLEKFWHKNCLAIGLSSAFTEPLEATSIHTTLLQLWYFVNEFAKSTFAETYSETAERMYNKRISRMFDDITDFLVAHYRTGRTDTDFWQYMNSNESLTSVTSDILEICKTRSPSSLDFNQYFGSLDWTLWSHVLHGTGNLSKNIAAKELLWYNRLQEGMRSHTMHEMEHEMLKHELLSNNEFMRKIFNA
jgi:tryptophan halogenase